MTRRSVISSYRGFESAHISFLIEEAPKLARPLMDKEAIAMLCFLLMAKYQHIKRLHENAMIAFVKNNAHRFQGAVMC